MRRAADNIDYILRSLRINLSAAGQGGWGTVMYVARRAAGDDRYGLQMREVL